jgi:calcium-dependent protein kinase
MDKNGDGKLSKQEILDGYEDHFNKILDEEQLEKLFSSVDIDGSGFIDYSEFIMATMNEKKNISEEKLVSAFKIFDKDDSGTISPDEIREVLGGATALSDEAVSSIIK